MSSAVGNIDLGFSPGDFLVFYPELILAPCDHLYLVLSTITTNSYSQMKASFRYPEVFCEKGVLTSYMKFTGKHLCECYT